MKWMKFMEKSLKPSKNLIKRKIGSLEYYYRVERRQVKYPRLEFKSINELLVILPIGNSNGLEFLDKKENWISKKLKEINDALKIVKSYKEKIEDNLLFLGDFYELEVLKGDYNIRLNKNKFVITTPKEILSIKFLKEWFTNELKKNIIDYLKLYSDELDFSYNKLNIIIRLQKTKWASCTSKKNLNFNLKLIFLPKELIKYVVLHELTHLREKKHNPKFWKIITKFFPDYKEKELQLLGFWFLIEENKFWKSILNNH